MSGIIILGLIVYALHLEGRIKILQQEKEYLETDKKDLKKQITLYKKHLHNQED